MSAIDGVKRVSWRKAVVVVLCAAVGATAGCGDGRPKRVPVSGQVLLDGKPLTRGTVNVIPSNARSAYGELGPDGRFTLSCFGDNDGAVLGTHKVTVTSMENVNELTRKWHAPREYSESHSSGLTTTIDQEGQDIVIELTWKGKGGKPYVEKLVGGEWRRQ